MSWSIKSMQLQTHFCFDPTMLDFTFVYFIPPFLDYCKNFKIRFLTLILIHISIFLVGKIRVSGTSGPGKDKGTVGCN